jgi:hypothetical protein
MMCAHFINIITQDDVHQIYLYNNGRELDLEFLFYVCRAFIICFDVLHIRPVEPFMFGSPYMYIHLLYIGHYMD